MSEYTPDEFNVRMAWIITGFGAEDALSAEFDRWLDRVLAAARREGQAEALRQAAYEFAEGAWKDQWSADEVECDVTAVQSTYRWFVAKADQIENGADQ